MTRLSVFIASSIDGYIATKDDKLDWLMSAGLPGEDYGFNEFMSTVDAVAMGRGTYDFIAEFEELPYGDCPIFVFTNRPPADRDGFTFWQASPREAVAHWESLGLSRVYVDGGVLISSFLAEGLIDDMLLTTVPLLLGEGRPLFLPISRSTPMTLTGSTSWPSGMINRTYTRA
jgi:dihydrofolate reductase